MLLCNVSMASLCIKVPMIYFSIIITLSVVLMGKSLIYTEINMPLLRNKETAATLKFALVAFRDSLSTRILDVNELKGPKSKVSGATVKVDNEGTGLVEKGTIVSISVDKQFLEKQAQTFNCRKFFGISGTATSKSVQTRKVKAPMLQRISKTSPIEPVSSTKIKVLSLANTKRLSGKSLSSSKEIPTSVPLEDLNSEITSSIIQVVVYDSSSKILNQSAQRSDPKEIEMTHPTSNSLSTTKDKSFRYDSFNNMSSLFNVYSNSRSLAQPHDGSMTSESCNTSALENWNLSELLNIMDPQTKSIAAPLLAEELEDSHVKNRFHESSSRVDHTKYHTVEEDGYFQLHSQSVPVEESTRAEGNHRVKKRILTSVEEMSITSSNRLHRDASIYTSTPMELYNRLGNTHTHTRLDESQFENKEVLKNIASESSRPEIFARNLLFRMFTMNELINCNVYGRCYQDGKQNGRLNAQKVRLIYEQTFKMFFEMRFSWRNCVLVMNRSIQHILKAFLPQRNIIADYDKAHIAWKDDVVSEPLNTTVCDSSLDLTIYSICSSIMCLQPDYTSVKLDASELSHDLCQCSKHQQEILGELIVSGHSIIQSTPKSLPTLRKASEMSLLKRLLKNSSTPKIITIWNKCYRSPLEHRLRLTPMELYSQHKERVHYPKIDDVMLQKPDIIDIIDAIFATCSRPETFSRDLAFRMFTLDDLSTCNVYGRGYTNGQRNERLDAAKVSTIRELTFQKFCGIRFSWRNCVLVMNKSIRCLFTMVM